MNQELLPCVEIDPPGAPRTCVLWLHGLGADGHDFEPIAAQLALPETLGVRFVFPHAPQRPVTINGGYVMRAWYDILAPGRGHVVDEAGIRDSRRQVERLIDRERSCGIPADGIVLAGFSQGGVIALEAAARYRETLGGVLALSTYLALPEPFPDAGKNIPIFMAHGTQDPIISYSLGVDSRNTLERKGYAVEWHSYPIPHAVCPEEIRDIRAWLLARLTAVCAARSDLA